MKAALILIYLTYGWIVYSQENSPASTGELHFKSQKENVKTFISLGFGPVLYGTSETVLAISPELFVHLGKGYIISGGIDYFKLPTSNEMYYMHLAFRKGILLGKFGLYPGIGLAVGGSSKGHPGITALSGYVSLNANYNFTPYFVGGADLKGASDFDFEDEFIILSFYVGYRF